MALSINGTGQNSFTMNGVSINKLYVDGTLVWKTNGTQDCTEKVTNGTFDTNVADWTPISDAILTWDAGRVKLLQHGAWRNMKQTISNLDSTKTYTIELDAEVGKLKAGDKLFAAISKADGTTAILPDILFLDGHMSTDFSPATGETEVNLKVGIGGGVDGDYAWFDNISIKEKGCSSSVIGFTPTPLPQQSDWVNVKDHGLKGDGSTDDTSALNTLAADTSKKNWYFPAGTYVLDEVLVPSHVQFVFGEGTLACKVSGTNIAHRGAIWFNDMGVPVHDNFVLNGLKFINLPTDQQNNAYGLVTISNGNHNGTNPQNINGFEIRNCTFRNTETGGGAREGLKIFARTTNVGTPMQEYRDMKIYNNKFDIHSGAFGAEMGTWIGTGIPFRKSRWAVRFEMFNNEFIGNGKPALSFVNDFAPESSTPSADTARIYNNRFTSCNWGIECGAVGGVHIYNNLMTDTRDYGIIASDNWKNDQLTPGRKNYWYKNHIECIYTSNTDYGMAFYPHSGDESEIYENFVKGQIRSRPQIMAGATGIPPLNAPYVHDNTIVTNSNTGGEFAHGILIRGDDTSEPYKFVGGGSEDNDIYVDTNVGNGIHSNFITSGVFHKNNNTYVKGSQDCYNVSNATVSGNKCTQTFTGGIPTGRAGAGLSDSSAVGVGNGSI